MSKFSSIDNFKPRGAMAFFVLLLLLGAAIWFFIFWLQLKVNS
jgi:hypothetical protein